MRWTFPKSGRRMREVFAKNELINFLKLKKFFITFEFEKIITQQQYDEREIQHAVSIRWHSFTFEYPTRKYCSNFRKLYSFDNFVEPYDKNKNAHFWYKMNNNNKPSMTSSFTNTVNKPSNAVGGSLSCTESVYLNILTPAPSRLVIHNRKY